VSLLGAYLIKLLKFDWLTGFHAIISLFNNHIFFFKILHPATFSEYSIGEPALHKLNDIAELPSAEYSLHASSYKTDLLSGFVWTVCHYIT